MKKLLNAILVLAMICGQSTMLKAKSNVTCSELTSTNADAQNYTLWSSPIYSYLEKTDEGWMRVLVDDGVKGYVVDYFDESFKETNRITVKEQLPIFGGFYASEKHYYIVSGQDNTNESNTKEVVRVSKYDKQIKIRGIVNYDFPDFLNE